MDKSIRCRIWAQTFGLHHGHRCPKEVPQNSHRSACIQERIFLFEVLTCHKGQTHYSDELLVFVKQSLCFGMKFDRFTLIGTSVEIRTHAVRQGYQPRLKMVRAIIFMWPMQRIDTLSEESNTFHLGLVEPIPTVFQLTSHQVLTAYCCECIIP